MAKIKSTEQSPDQLKSQPLESEKNKAKKVRITKKKRRYYSVTKGRVYIIATYNNTIITVTDLIGNTLAWSSAGHLGFKGPKKATPYVASLVIKNVFEKIENNQLKEVEVLVKGVGSGRDAAIRALHAQGLIINLIKDITPVPHNGCRPPKLRRV